jgi:chromosomal replication initiation ATPase DnaA
MLIATLGELFEANHVQIGEGALQVVASTSDETVRELFKAYAQR